MKNLIKLVKEENLSPNCIYVLYCLANKLAISIQSVEYRDTFNILFTQMYIDKDNNLTDKGKRFCIDNLGKNIFIIDEPEDEIEEFIDSFRKLFKGYKAGSMGDRNACIAKMKRFYKQYPQYANKDTIFAATKNYISSLNNFQYLKQADYFIYKQDSHKTDSSMLAVYCEELDLKIESKKDEFTEMI